MLDEPEEDALRETIARAEKETGRRRKASTSIPCRTRTGWRARWRDWSPCAPGASSFMAAMTAKLPSGAIPLLVDAEQAFGTGHHETTAGCLEFISEMLRPGVPLNALDIGTGTGVLAIAIARLAHVNVLASDIDPVAVAVTKANARANGVGPFVTALTAKGFGHTGLAARAPYDLIVANILARPLVSLAPAFRAHMKPGGTLILSGTLRSQENMVAGAMRMQGLRLVSRKPKGDWVTLRMER